MADLLLDTDVLVDHLRGARRLTRGSDRISYSVITRAELFAGRVEEEGAIGRLLASFHEIGLGREIAELGGRLRREAGLLLPDALIGATALAHECTLVTRNLRRFEPISGLGVRAPE